MKQPFDSTQKSQPSQEDSEAIWEIRKLLEDAFRRNDSQAINATFTDEPVFILSDGQILNGKEAINEIHAALFRKFPRIRIEFTRTSLRFPSPNVAIEDVTYIEEREGSPPIRGGDTTVLVKRNERWLVDYVRLHIPTGGA